MKNLKLLVGLMGLSSLCLSHAETVTANTEVSTTVTASCTISISDITFDPFSPNDTSTHNNGGTMYQKSSELKVIPACTKGTSYSISASPGVIGPLFGKMTHTVDSSVQIDYGLVYRDPATSTSTIISPNTNFITLIGDGFDGADQSFDFWANMKKRNVDNFRRAIAGTYTDTATLIITY